MFLNKINYKRCILNAYTMYVCRLLVQSNTTIKMLVLLNNVETELIEI